VPALSELGATLVALTPQLPEHSQAMAREHELGFDILSDPGNVYAAELGLRFALPAALRAVYTSFGLDLAATNGDASWTLPMPARLLIDPTGIVRAADIDPDYTRRPEPARTLDQLRALVR
jgi:peroxiredoxin